MEDGSREESQVDGTVMIDCSQCHYVEVMEGGWQ